MTACFGPAVCYQSYIFCQSWSNFRYFLQCLRNIFVFNKQINYVIMSQKVLFLTKFLTVIIIAIQVPFGCTEINFKFSNPSKNVNSSLVYTSPAFSSSEKPFRLTVKKWQVGRVSRKHYEIVNMLWRKTKIFINSETTTPSEYRYRRNHQTATSLTNYENIKPLTQSSLKSLFPSSTPSFIEFYYLDDNDERIKRRDSFLSTLPKTQRKPVRENQFRKSPILSLRVDDHINNSPPKINLAIDKEAPEPSPLIRKRPIIHQKPSIYGFLSNKFKIDLAPVVKSNTFMFNHNTKNIVTTEKYFNNETCPVTTEPEISINLTTHQNSPNTHNSNKIQNETTSIVYANTTSNKIQSTTAYDKIKFFEMYDQHTMMPITRSITDKIVNKDDSENMIIENKIDVNQKVNLEDVDRNIGHHDGTKIKYVKKHIDENIKPPTNNRNNSKSEKKIKFKTVIFNFNKTDIKKSEAETTYKALMKLQNDTTIFLKNSSRVAKLSEYPFAAVYVYEPSQIHCDAAALSPHWLVSAGSCLSRFHRKDPVTEGRSAFVAYCGQNWWQPERVSYVKYSIVHPRFHPKDTTRRFLYNIGLIQVVGSMSSCFGWAPVSLMSHNFASDSDGSIATAVGWGLDRYDVRYTSVELPRLPLSAYDGFVYSNSCPGSKALGKVKLYNDQSSILKNNIYCLSLPSYSGEENDPVHGSLLLVGGKLIALYLQEERRIWGEQSAQYTGVWRLVPWVHEVAREPDEVDGFGIDI